MLKYQLVVEESDTWLDNLLKIKAQLHKGMLGASADKYNARNDMLTMVNQMEKYVMSLHRELVICRQRKKTTVALEQLYARAKEYKQAVEGNLLMYNLMYA